MRADMAAAYLDLRDTKELARAVGRGEAPPPSALRGSGRKREPIWAKVSLDDYIAPMTDALGDKARGEERLRSLL